MDMWIECAERVAAQPTNGSIKGLHQHLIVFGYTCSFVFVTTSTSRLYVNQIN